MKILNRNLEQITRFDEKKLNEVNCSISGFAVVVVKLICPVCTGTQRISNQVRAFIQLIIIIRNKVIVITEIVRFSFSGEKMFNHTFDVHSFARMTQNYHQFWLEAM